MSTKTVSPLRHRMIEDMSLRNLAPRTQEHYIRSCKKLAAFSAASRRAGGEHLHPQPHDDGRGLPVSCDAETP